MAHTATTTPSTKPRQKPPLPSPADDLPSAISNGDDIGPLIRQAFAADKPETLLLHLKAISRQKDSEIQDLCRAHYQDFITAVENLRALLSDAESLKSSLSASNSHLRAVALPLLTSLDSFLEARNTCLKVSLALASVRSLVRVLELCSRANHHLTRGSFYMALKCLDAIESDFVDETPSSAIKKMLETKIPEIRSYIERKVMKDFNDWLVAIRAVCRNVGQLAIGQASSARQREEETRIKQRLAEEQSRRDCVYALEEEDNEDLAGNDISSVGLTPLYRAYHIHQALGAEERFKKYYYENRKLQLTSDFQVSGVTPFLESHQTFFAQIAGFFIVEDRVVRTGGGLISILEVEKLWESAVSKMCSVLEDQFSRMETANHLLLIKDYVSLLAVTLRRSGYLVEPLLDVLSKHRDKYHELLLSECRKQIGEAVYADKFDPMLMKKEYEYSMHVLSLQIQTSDIMPAFPYVAPFSSTVPDCCRIVRSFIEDSVSFMSYGGEADFFEVVKKYLHRLLSEDLDGALVELIKTSIGAVPQAMQVAANMAVMERACDFFFRHAAQLSGIPLRMVERDRKQFPLCKARDAAEDKLSGLVKQKVDGFMLLMEEVNWMADETLQNGNEYVNEVIIYLETLVSTAQQILPPKVLKRALKDVLSHISGKILEALYGDAVKRFTVQAIMSLDVDIRLLETFADNQAPLLSEEEASQLKLAVAESRQMVNLLLSNNPEAFINPVIRERSYNILDYRKIVIVSDKMRDSSENIFGTFGNRGSSKQNPKKKSLDVLIKRLKEVS